MIHEYQTSMQDQGEAGAYEKPPCAKHTHLVGALGNKSGLLDFFRSLMNPTTQKPEVILAIVRWKVRLSLIYLLSKFFRTRRTFSNFHFSLRPNMNSLECSIRYEVKKKMFIPRRTICLRSRIVHTVQLPMP